MKYQKYIFTFIIFVTIQFTSLAQPSAIDFYSEYSVLPADSDFINFYYSFRVNNSFLVFEKEGDGFSASFRVSIELKDSATNNVKREFIERKIFTLNFDETNSKDISIEETIKFNLPKGQYSASPVFLDKNSRREIQLRNFNIDFREFNKSIILSPLCVVSNFVCNNQNGYRLSNYEGNIPFSSDNYDLIFPVTDNSIDTLYISVEGELETHKFVLKDFFYSNLSIEKCSTSVIVNPLTHGYQTKNFRLNNFSHLFSEGKIKLKVTSDKNKKPIIFHKEVKWINKPLSLNNLEFAIRMLSNIESDSLMYSILRSKNDDLKKNLNLYWLKNDPSPGTKYNELMNEFYHRVDYANKNFTTLGAKIGAESWRGKIRIKYGTPDSIKRINNNEGKVSEIWFYKKLNKKFIFTDKNGTGKYDLKEVL